MTSAGHGLDLDLLVFVVRPWPAPARNDNGDRIVVLKEKTS